MGLSVFWKKVCYFLFISFVSDYPRSCQWYLTPTRVLFSEFAWTWRQQRSQCPRGQTICKKQFLGILTLDPVFGSVRSSRSGNLCSSLWWQVIYIRALNLHSSGSDLQTALEISLSQLVNFISKLTLITHFFNRRSLKYIVLLTRDTWTLPSVPGHWAPPSAVLTRGSGTHWMTGSGDWCPHPHCSPSPPSSHHRWPAPGTWAYPDPPSCSPHRPGHSQTTAQYKHQFFFSELAP